MRPRFNPQDVRGTNIPARIPPPNFVRTTAPVAPQMHRTTAPVPPQMRRTTIALDDGLAPEQELEYRAERAMGLAIDGGNKLIFSNYHITVVLNVNATELEEDALFDWLIHNCQEIFGSWENLNNFVFKPAGTRNDQEIKIDDVLGIRVISVRTVIGLELGEARRHPHAHCVMEVAHESQDDPANPVAPSGKTYKGVHVNVATMKAYFNEHLHEIDIARHRIPAQIYLNSRLLTTGTDNSRKFLTLQYIGKTTARDNDGGRRNLLADRAMADPDDQRVHEGLANQAYDHLDVEVNESTFGGLMRDE